MAREGALLNGNLPLTQSTKGNPRLAQTPIGTPITGPHRARIRHTAVNAPFSFRHESVSLAVNIDIGRLMAVKIIHCAPGISDGDKIDAFKREVEALSTLRHHHIAEYIGSQGFRGPRLEIFMGFKQGSLRSLVENASIGVAPAINHAIYDVALHQMLQAIDYLAMLGIVHRDLKPESIFFSSDSQTYRFQLGDFGSCTKAGIATPTVGSFLYMAPEAGNGIPTHGLDVWALYVTIIWAMDMCQFRTFSHEFVSSVQVHEWIFKMIPEQEPISQIREMANPDPSERASAAQMLVEVYNGQGLVSTWTAPGPTAG
ncbi:kinase-like domain-containing protein [Dactylonectria macrodidyma]|uniref:Kinase-like domain-containing protein n=1 Tax=Dactylonectria macrodidyma TaxID=307937 RepID=A0A9P9EWJ3_9HYPO|nr:kinase-like domain-containing protein [Dactylonectria macrodidyma]